MKSFFGIFDVAIVFVLVVIFFGGAFYNLGKEEQKRESQKAARQMLINFGCAEVDALGNMTFTGPCNPKESLERWANKQKPVDVRKTLGVER